MEMAGVGSLPGMFPTPPEPEVGKVQKRIVRDGHGTRQAPKGANVRVKYELRERVGEEVKVVEVKELEGVLGVTALPRLVEEQVALMVKGEVREVEYNPNDGDNNAPARPGCDAVIYSLELLDWDFEDVLVAGGGVTKRTKIEGHGWEQPVPDATVTLVVHTSTVPFPHTTYIIGGSEEYDMLLGLDIALETMRKGERAVLTMTKEYCGGLEEGMAMDVELVEFTNPKEVYDHPIEERLEEGIKRKEQGNKYYSRKMLREAMARYQRGLKYVNENFGLGIEEKESLLRAQIPLLNNLATCQFALGDYKGAAASSAKVLDFTPDAKALLRRARANNKLSNWEECSEDLKRLVEAFPEQKEAAEKERALLQQRRAQHRKAEKATFGGMFDRK